MKCVNYDNPSAKSVAVTFTCNVATHCRSSRKYLTDLHGKLASEFYIRVLTTGSTILVRLIGNNHASLSHPYLWDDVASCRLAMSLLLCCKLGAM